jgi:hypothetical protein
MFSVAECELVIGGLIYSCGKYDGLRAIHAHNRPTRRAWLRVEDVGSM